MTEPGGPFASGMLLWQVAKGYVSDAEITFFTAIFAR
jgi:hypothetical protein